MYGAACVLCGDWLVVRYFCSKCENPNKWFPIIDKIRHGLLTTNCYLRFIPEALSNLEKYPFDGKIICPLLPELEMFKNTRIQVKNTVVQPVFIQFRASIVITFLLCTRLSLPTDIQRVIAKIIHKEMKEVYFERDDGRWKITKEWELIKI